MAERKDAGKAQEEIHGHCREPEHKHARPQRRVAAERHHPKGSEQKRRPDRGERDQLACVPFSPHVSMPSSPSKPRGRTSSTSAMITYMIASLAAGRNTAVSPDATPISSPPNSVPVRLPTPPTMMAMKLGMRRPVPMVGSRPSWPAASTPLRPARKIPPPKLSERTRPPLMPRADT